MPGKSGGEWYLELFILDRSRNPFLGEVSLLELSFKRFSKLHPDIGYKDDVSLCSKCSI
jgi:hypothetical protein